MEFKNVVIGNNVYGEDIKLPEVGQGFDFSRITRKFSNPKLRESKEEKISQSSSFNSKKLNYDMTQNTSKNNKA
mgnify:CR=1 FL=1